LGAVEEEGTAEGNGVRFKKAPRIRCNVFDLCFVTGLTYFLEGKAKVEGKAKGGGTVRKVLLLAALAMVATLVLSAPVIAQDEWDCPDLSEAEEQAVFNADRSDPNGLDENDNGVPCEEDTTDNGSYEAPTDDSTPTPEPTTVEPTTVEPTTTTPTAGADDAQYKTASPTITALPETGGSVSVAAAMIPLALLVGGGLLAFGIVRRG
jgi:hypothetical protein